MNVLINIFPGFAVAYHVMTFFLFSLLLSLLGILVSRYFNWNALYRYQLLAAVWMVTVMLPVATILTQQMEWNLFTAYYYLDFPIETAVSPHKLNDIDENISNQRISTAFIKSSLPVKEGFTGEEKLTVLLSGLFIIWAIGSGFLLLRFMSCLFKLVCIHSQSNTDNDDNIQSICFDVFQDMGLSRHPRIAASSKVGCPGVVGFKNPVIVLPKKIIPNITPEQLRQVIRHESAHILRGDQWMILIERFSFIWLWPNFLLRIVLKQLHEAREEICDNYVLDITEGTQYGKTLLDIAQLVPKKGITSVPAGLFNTQSSLERRIKKIMSTRRKTMKKSSIKTILSIAAFTMIGTIGISLIHPAWGIDPEIKERIQIEKAEIKELLQAGKISKLEAKAKIAAMKLAIYEDALEEFEEHAENEIGAKHSKYERNEFGEYHLGHESSNRIKAYREDDGRLRRYREIEERIKDAVEAGKISREDAERRLIETRRDMFREDHDDDADDVRVRRYRAIEEEIKHEVDAGKVSREDAERKLIEIRRDMFSEDRNDDVDDARVRRYRVVEEEIKHEVDAGKVSREDAERRLKETRSNIFRNDQDEHADDGRLRRYREVEERIKDAVKEGKVSREDAEKRLLGARRDIFQDHGRDDTQDAIEERLMGFRKELGEAVRAGKLSKEEAKDKFEAARKDIQKRVEHSQKENIEIKEYMEKAGREIRIAIQSGKISEEEGREKMEHVRREIQEKLERMNKEQMDDEIEEHLEGVWKRLLHGVEEGDMTKKEAESKMAEIERRAFSERR